MRERFKYETSDGKELAAVRWKGERAVALLQISHGMAEHIGRYEEFAIYLTRHGWVVYGSDIRGHGRSVEPGEIHGHLSDKDGWKKILDDVDVFSRRIRKEHPDLPLFLMGHSMGSFLLRHHVSLHGSEVNGAILMGSGEPGKWAGRLIRGIAVMMGCLKGGRHVSPLLGSIVFGPYLKRFRPLRTSYDWLSRKTEEVDRYAADPHCGFHCTVQFFKDFAEGIIEVADSATYKKTPNDLPLLLYSGDEDPVGRKGKDIRLICRKYRQAGVKDVSFFLEKKGRHEILKEEGRERVFQLLRAWLEGYLEPSFDQSQEKEEGEE